MNRIVILDNFITALSEMNAEEMGAIFSADTQLLLNGKKHRGTKAVDMILRQFKGVTGGADSFVLERQTYNAFTLCSIYEQIVSVMKLTLNYGTIGTTHHISVDLIHDIQQVISIVMLKTVAPIRIIKIHTTDDQNIIIRADQVFYIKTEGNKIVWDTEEGTFVEKASLAARLDDLPDDIQRMGKYYAINLCKVIKIENGHLILHGEKIKIPHGKVKIYQNVIKGNQHSL